MLWAVSDSVHRVTHGTRDYAGEAGSGKAEFIAANLDRYGVPGRLSGKIRTQPKPARTPQRSNLPLSANAASAPCKSVE
jgi:hypothetical protein